MLKLAALSCLALLLSGCVVSPQDAPASTFVAGEPLQFVDVQLAASDGTRLSATYLASSRPNDSVGIVFLHMLGSERTAWRDLQASAPHASIAVDFRGHGNSEGDLRGFAQADYAKFVLDASAAAGFLESKGATSFYIVGASIGANAALALAANDSRVKKLALLSPGMDYRGVSADGLPARFAGESLYAAAEADAYSADSAKTLRSQAAGAAQLEIIAGNAHGTGLLADGPFYERLLNFLE